LKEKSITQKASAGATRERSEDELETRNVLKEEGYIRGTSRKSGWRNGTGEKLSETEPKKNMT